MTWAPDRSLVRNERVFLAALIVVAALFRFYRIGAQSLWVDEMLTVSVSIPKDGLNIWSYVKFNIHGPLHSFVVYLFQLVSRGDAWLRLPSALAGVGVVVYFYLWIRMWVGRYVAQIGAVLIAVHPLLVYYSHELR
ncbi:MAG: glycosyltransferase family 39 protein, partial [Candidatus Krumholzibacteria bacterium]|nr:glycosyltransferase family 39 protein [Candidatus Krumholzibacteria bacterium]